MSVLTERDRTVLAYQDTLDDWIHLSAFDVLASKIPTESGKTWLWYDGGDEILTYTEEQAEAVLRWLIAHGEQDARMDYYDPKEDLLNNEIDNHTGFWSVQAY